MEPTGKLKKIQGRTKAKLKDSITCLLYVFYKFYKLKLHFIISLSSFISPILFDQELHPLFHL